MSILRRAIRWTSLAILVGLAGWIYLIYAPAGDDAPHPFNHDRNAVWLEHRWLDRPQSRSQMDQLFQSLHERGVAYVFPHLIPFDREGRLPRHSPEQMQAFLSAARRVSPSIQVLPWVGGLRVGYKRQRAGTIDLTDGVQRQQMIAECRTLMDEGFDGIHLNVEPVSDGNVDFLTLLRALRPVVGASRTLSVAAVRPGPIAPPWIRNFFWTPGFYAQIGAVADQIVVMAYDTAVPTPPLYRRYMSYAASSVTSTLIGSHSRARVLVGIPTYDETGRMHRAGVETLENGLLGVVAGLRGLGPGGTFEGVALYAEWTTDPSEWNVYERFWRGRSDTQAERGAQDAGRTLR